MKETGAEAAEVGTLALGMYIRGACVNWGAGPGVTWPWWGPAPWGWPGICATGPAKMNCPCCDGLGWGWPGGVAVPCNACMLPATTGQKTMESCNGIVCTVILDLGYKWVHRACICSLKKLSPVLTMPHFVKSNKTLHMLMVSSMQIAQAKLLWVWKFLKVLLQWIIGPHTFLSTTCLVWKADSDTV